MHTGLSAKGFVILFSFTVIMYTPLAQCTTKNALLLPGSPSVPRTEEMRMVRIYV